MVYMEVAIPGVHAYTTLGDIVPCIYAWYACPYYTGGCTGTLGLYDTMIQCEGDRDTMVLGAYHSLVYISLLVSSSIDGPG